MAGGQRPHYIEERPGTRTIVGRHHRIDRMSVDRLRDAWGTWEPQQKGLWQSIPMTATTLETWNTLRRTRPIAAAAMIIALGGAATILGAWFFQYGLGLKPCPLCLEQRYPYYFAIPLAVLVILGDSVGSKRKVLLAALVAIAAGMLWNAGLGAYHAGVEWKLWAGPQECSGALESLGNATDMLERLGQNSNVGRCD